MKIIDIMGMDMARNEWACATLNEFRSFLKLAKYNSFEGQFAFLVLALTYSCIESHDDSIDS